MLKKMNYGLLVYKETDNIGDDIQSYAAEQFLPRTDCLIDRESMHVFCPDEDEGQLTAVIMNAWFMYHKYNWPPSVYILPYFTAVHVSETDYYQIGEDFFNEQNIAYFQKYAPVGCRDRHTLQMFAKKNITAYFSGCLTLTLKKQPGIAKKDCIYLVDVDDEIRKKTESFGLPYEIVTATHDMQPHTQFDWELRREAVRRRLAEYQSARLVVTTRLHCALPCLALDTDVILICEPQAYFKDRMEDYLPYLRHCTKQEFLSSSYAQLSADKDRSQDPPLSDIKKQLADGVAGFLDQARAYEKKNLPKADKNYWHRRLQAQSELMKLQLPKLKRMHDRIWELEKENAWQREETEGLKQSFEMEQRKKQEWYEKREAWLQEKIKGTQEWYEKRESWLQEKIRGTQEWYEKRESWNRNQQACLEQEIKNLKLRLQTEQNEVWQWSCRYDTLANSRALKIGNQILYWPRKIKQFFKLCGEVRGKDVDKK